MKARAAAFASGERFGFVGMVQVWLSDQTASDANSFGRLATVTAHVRWLAC